MPPETLPVAGACFNVWGEQLGEVCPSAGASGTSGCCLVRGEGEGPSAWLSVCTHRCVCVRVRVCARTRVRVFGGCQPEHWPRGCQLACVFFKARGPVAEELDYLVKSAPLSPFSFGPDSLLELLLFLVVLFFFSIVVKYN